MTAKLTFAGAARALNERRPAVVERWLATFGRSVLRLPGSVDLRELQGIADTIASVESYWIGFGLTWRFGRGACEDLGIANDWGCSDG